MATFLRLSVLQEMDRAVEEHMKKLFPTRVSPPASVEKLATIFQACDINSWWDVLELAALCVDPPEHVVQDAMQEEAEPSQDAGDPEYPT